MATEPIGVWVAIAIGLVSTLVAIAVLWGGLRKSHENLEATVARQHEEGKVDDARSIAEFYRFRDEEFKEYKAERRNVLNLVHSWQEVQDRRLHRLELANARTVGRLHRLEDGEGVTPPPKEDDNDDST